MKSKLHAREAVRANGPSSATNRVTSVHTEKADRDPPRETSPRTQILSSVSAVVLLLLLMWAGFVNIGLPPVVIVGGSGLVALVMWRRTYLRYPADPSVILPVFLLTVAALDVHMAEEYLTGFGPAMSRVFDISWTERSFLMIFAFFGPSLYALTAIGLYLPRPHRGIRRLVHLHRSRRRGVHPFHLPAVAAGLESHGDVHHQRPRVERAPGHGYAELLDRRDWSVLLSRHVHGRPSDDPWHLCHLPAAAARRRWPVVLKDNS